MKPRGALLFSLSIGVLHAVVLIFVAVELGYRVGPSEYALLGMLWRYGGLLVLGAIPVWFAARHKIVVPLFALLLTSGYVLGIELTPPGPTFRDVAELERLAEPTGIMVVENGLYLVRYMVNASVWAVGFLFLALVEYSVRSEWARLPGVSIPSQKITIPASRRPAAIVAAVSGLLHAIVMVGFALRLGVTVSSGLGWAYFSFSALGMWLLAAIPIYLLLRHQLIVPAILLTGFVLFDVLAEFSAGPADPHALYFGGWFIFLGVILVGAAIEYGLRWLERGRLSKSMS